MTLPQVSIRSRINAGSCSSCQDRSDEDVIHVELRMGSIRPCRRCAADLHNKLRVCNTQLAEKKGLI